MPSSTKLPAKYQPATPMIVVQHTGKRMLGCLVQSLATISLAYGHYPVVPCQTPPHLRKKVRHAPSTSSLSCDIHSIPDKIAQKHNLKERRKAAECPARNRSTRSTASRAASLAYARYGDSVESLIGQDGREPVQVVEFL